MHVDYMKTESYLDSIEIDDIGKCAIKAMNDEGLAWYLRIKTELGWSFITVFGPVEADDNSFINRFNLNYFEMEFNSKKLYKIIKEFINDSKKEITQIDLQTPDECGIIEKMILENWKTD